MKIKKRNMIIIISVITIIFLLGVSYAFFDYYREGVNNQIVAGEVYLKYNEGTDTIYLTNVFPSTAEKARARTDNVVTFTLTGKNTVENKDIYYEILLNNGSDISGKTRFNNSDLVFDLVEVVNGVETRVVDARSFSDFNSRRIWVNKVNKNTTTEITRTYKLRMWLDENVVISDTETSADYTTEEFRNSYASVTVSVLGDFAVKEVPEY